MIPVLLDHRPPYFDDPSLGSSLLSLPVGRETVFDRALASVGCRSEQQIVVIASFPAHAVYKERLQDVAGRDVLILEVLAVCEWAATLESQEIVCVLDTMRQPLASFDLQHLWQTHSFGRGATHFICVGHGPDAVSEGLERDAVGRVRRVRRSYTRVAPRELANTAIFATVVRAPAIREVTFGSSKQLREALCRKGVLASDVALNAGLADLSDESGLLKLSDLAIKQLQGQSKQNGGGGASQALHDPTVSIHPTAKLIGPVVLQRGSTLEEDVTVVGPTVIGRKAHLAAGSTVVQSLIASSVEVPAGADVFHRVIAGKRIVGPRDRVSPEWLTPISFAGGAERQLGEVRFRFLSKSGAVRRKAVQAFLKPVIDFMLAFLGLTFLWPGMLIVAVLIKLDSKGPVFFRHQREGVGGEEFFCLKYRTMVADAHQQQGELYANNEVDGPQFKMDRDPRITRLGQFLRGTNIDELPQLFNVLMGQMSLIGPRPSPFRENQICVSWRRARLSVRPGISGMWQICRDTREGGDFHQWIHYDVLYVRHWSLWLDLKILVATISTLGGRWRVPVEWLLSPAHLRAGYAAGDEYGCGDDPSDSSWPDTSAA